MQIVLRNIKLYYVKKMWNHLLISVVKVQIFVVIKKFFFLALIIIYCRSLQLPSITQNCWKISWKTHVLEASGCSASGGTCPGRGRGGFGGGPRAPSCPRTTPATGKTKTKNTNNSNGENGGRRARGILKPTAADF